MLIFTLLGISGVTASEANRIAYAETILEYGNSIGQIKHRFGPPQRSSTKALAVRYNQTKSELLTLIYPSLSITVWKGEFDDNSSRELLTNVTFDSCRSIQITPCFIGHTSEELINYFGKPNSEFSSKTSFIYMIAFGDGGFAPIKFELKNSIVKSASIESYVD